ncbi:MAG: GC-type dockerin domain-anchored protein [Phycisphaerales bacterium]
MRSRLIMFLVALWVGAPAVAQCGPYFRDLGSTIYPMGFARFAVIDEAGLRPLYRTDFQSPLSWRWTGTVWQPLPNDGLPAGALYDFVWGLRDGSGTRRLYAGGRAGTASWFYRFEGTHWVPSGMCVGNCPGFQPAGGRLTFVDFGAGAQAFATAYPPFEDQVIVRWDQTQWTVIGQMNLGRSADILVAFDDGTGLGLYALGFFQTMNGLPVRGMAKWNGSAWSDPMPSHYIVGVQNAYTVASLGNGEALYVEANVVTNGIGRTGVHKWKSPTWTYIGKPDPRPPPLTPSYVDALAAYDDGRGAALYIAGVFFGFEGVPARSLIRWDGQSFERVGDGTVGDTFKMYACTTERGPALFVYGGGETFQANGGVITQPAFFVLGCNPPAPPIPGNCAADCDGNHTLNVADFTCFLDQYVAGRPYANCDGSGLGVYPNHHIQPKINVADFGCFLTRYAQGCP